MFYLSCRRFISSSRQQSAFSSTFIVTFLSKFIAIHILISVDLQVHVRVPLHIYIYLLGQLRIRLNALIHVHLTVLLVTVTFITMVSTVMLDLLRWFCPVPAFGSVRSFPRRSGTELRSVRGRRELASGIEENHALTDSHLLLFVVIQD
jgi:hypothetical protein